MKNAILTLKILSIAALFMAFAVSCDKDDDDDDVPMMPKNIVEVASADPQFSTLVSAIQSTDLDAALSATGPFTVFAPTDQAFEDLGIDLSTLSKEQLAGILTYHVVAGKVLSTGLSEGLVETLNGAAVSITLSGGVKVDDANVVTPDVTASNGVIHVIDKVIFPPDQTIPEVAISQAPEFTTLVDALVETGLDAALGAEGPFTVFAPTNQAFEDLGVDLSTLSTEELTKILKYHVVSGRVFSKDLEDGEVETLLDGKYITVDVANLKINDAGLVAGMVDVQASNGVIHVIDMVLDYPKNIVETAVNAAPEFTTLVEALQRVDLDAALAGDGPFTVFAPTNQAFEDLGVDLSTLSDEDLTNILLYHVVNGTVKSTDLSNSFVETLSEGNYIEVNVDSDVMINDATVATPDVMASNGVIHIIDKVILPPSQNIVEIAVAQDPEFTTLVEALQRVDLDVALSGEGPFTVFAPTNQAFEDLGVDLGTLTDQELTDILLYHVVSGNVFSTDLSNGTVETLLDGSSITVDVTNLKINDSNLVTSLLNIQGTNGVIHVIDAVLLPPAE